MLQSTGRFDTPIRFIDSLKFVLPIVRLARSSLEWPNVNALPSLFLEGLIPTLGKNWFHMQISTVNDLVLRRLRITDSTGLKWRLLAPAAERLMFGWCGLHSDLSHGFVGTLSHGNAGNAGVMKLEPLMNANTAKVIRHYVRYLMRKGLKFKTLFWPQPIVSDIGGGNHFGGSWPMTVVPRRFNECDQLGRPAGWERVHLVDGAVLPSIPATTAALVIMANADRIASNVDLT